MTDSLRTRIAAALQNHRQGQVGGGWLTCSCDEHWSRFSSAVYDGHVADAVIAELGLEPQVHYDPDCEFYRYVTDWIDPQNNQRVDLP